MDEQERAIAAECFAEVIAQCRYVCYACAIMPDHIHILIRKHRDLAENMILHFQHVSRLRFRADGIHGAIHPVWGGPGWKVFLDTPDDVWRTIQYIKDNPIKIGLPAQEWTFVVEYDNWPLHKK